MSENHAIQEVADPHQRAARHGTEQGYLAGCRSRGGCPHHDSRDVATCAEAHIVRRSVYSVSRLPIDEPVRRSLFELRSSAASKPDGVARGVPMAGSREPSPVARNTKKEPAHGTVTGYLKGCRRHEECPRNADGKSCQQVRNESRRTLARRRGVAEKARPVSAHPARERIRELEEAGASLRSIALECGVGHTTIANIARGRASVVLPCTLEKILMLAMSDAKE